MKPSDKNSIDNLFKQGLSDFEISPSSNVWAGIERSLDRETKGKSNKAFFRLAIAASVLICLFVGYYWMNIPNDKIQIASVNTPVEDKKIDQKVEEKGSDKNILVPMQPLQKDHRLADVVELKSKTQRPLKLIKKENTFNQNRKTKRTEDENNAIDLLKKLENEQAEMEVEKQDRKISAPKTTPVAPANIAAAISEKKEVNNVIDLLNFVANKVSGNEDSKLVAINDKKKPDGTGRKSYKIDLGFVKLTRVKNTN